MTHSNNHDLYRMMAQEQSDAMLRHQTQEGQVRNNKTARTGLLSRFFSGLRSSLRREPRRTDRRTVRPA